jgi:hypothetical protein
MARRPETGGLDQHWHWHRVSFGEHALGRFETFVAAALVAGNKQRDLSMEQLIREFGAWLKEGFDWLVDVIVFGCLWGISEVSRLFSTQLGGAPILKIAVLLLVLLLILYAFYWVFGRFIGVIRWALDRIAYALGVILFSAAVVSGVFASAGLVAVVAIWVMGNINLASR